jgi:hypothetical protein
MLVRITGAQHWHFLYVVLNVLMCVKPLVQLKASQSDLEEREPLKVEESRAPRVA